MGFKFYAYFLQPLNRKVETRSTSQLVAHPRIFSLFMKGKCDPYVDKKSPKLKSSPFSFLRQYGSLPIIGNYLSGIPLHHKPIVEVVLVSILQGNITLLDWGNFFMNKFTPKWRCRKSSVINVIFSQNFFCMIKNVSKGMPMY